MALPQRGAGVGAGSPGPGRCPGVEPLFQNLCSEVCLKGDAGLWLNKGRGTPGKPWPLTRDGAQPAQEPRGRLQPWQEQLGSAVWVWPPPRSGGGAARGRRGGQRGAALVCPASPVPARFGLKATAVPRTEDFGLFISSRVQRDYAERKPRERNANECRKGKCPQVPPIGFCQVACAGL